MANPDKSPLVRIILDTGCNTGSRILALVDEEHAAYLLDYYNLQFPGVLLREQQKLEAARKFVEALEISDLRADLRTGRILALYRTFGRGSV